MHLNFITIGIIAGLILTLLVGIFCYTAYDNEHWIAKTIISGLIMTTISVYAGTIDNTNTNIEKSIKNTITSNYDNVFNYHYFYQRISNYMIHPCIIFFLIDTCYDFWYNDFV